MREKAPRFNKLTVNERTVNEMTATELIEPVELPREGAQQVSMGTGEHSLARDNGIGSRFAGVVSVAGAPADGYRVTFSYEPDGPLVPQQPALSGSDGKPGAYSHILSVAVRRVGDWYAWLIDGDGQRISTIAAFHTDGNSNQCNDAQIDFER